LQQIPVLDAPYVNNSCRSPPTLLRAGLREEQVACLDPLRPMNRVSWFHHRKPSQDYRSTPSMLGLRRWTRHSVAVTLLAVIATILVYSHYDSPQFFTSKIAANASRSGNAQSDISPYHRSRVLKGPPTESFRGKRYCPKACIILLF